MADAKKCDHCGDLYETAAGLRPDDPHEVEVRRGHGWEKPDISASIVLFKPRERDGAIDDCRKCTILAVRKFMNKFGIREDKGGTIFRFFPDTTSKGIILNSVVEGEPKTMREFFGLYLNENIEVTVRVLK